MFGFQSIERKVFNRNFLRKVIFQVQFDSCKNLKDNSEKIKTLFALEFPRYKLGRGGGVQISFNKDKADFEELKNRDNINLKSLDGQKTINIEENSLLFEIEGSVYKSFEDIRREFEKFDNFFSTCQIDQIKSLSIRKINIIEFKNESNPDGPNGILDALLNKSLINSNDSFPNMSNINHNIHSINFSKDDYLLNLNYGMKLLPQLNNERGQLIIDINLSLKNSITTKEIPTLSKNINDEIFNVFYWMLNEDAKSLLLS